MLTKHFEKEDKKLNLSPYEKFNYVCSMTLILYSSICLLIPVIFRLLGVYDWFTYRPTLYVICYVGAGIMTLFIVVLNKDEKSIKTQSRYMKFMIIPVIIAMTLLTPQVFWVIFWLIVIIAIIMLFFNTKLEVETYWIYMTGSVIFSLIIYIALAIFYIGFSYNTFFHIFLGGYLLFAFLKGFGKSLLVSNYIYDLISQKYPNNNKTEHLIAVTIDPLHHKICSEPHVTGYYWGLINFVQSFLILGDVLQEAEEIDIKKR